jgi:hypothetical protein
MKKWLYINWALTAAGYNDFTLSRVELISLDSDGTLTYSDNGEIKTINLISGSRDNTINDYVVNDYIVDYFE